VSIPSESECDKKQNSFYNLVFFMPNTLSSVEIECLCFIMKHQSEDPCQLEDKEYFGWRIGIVMYHNYSRSEKCTGFFLNGTWKIFFTKLYFTETGILFLVEALIFMNCLEIGLCFVLRKSLIALIQKYLLYSRVILFNV